MRSLANGCWMLLMGQDLGHFSWMKTIMKTLGSWWVLMSPGPRHVGQPPAKKNGWNSCPIPRAKECYRWTRQAAYPTAGSSCLVSTKLYRDPNAQPKDLQSRSSKFFKAHLCFSSDSGALNLTRFIRAARAAGQGTTISSFKETTTISPAVKVKGVWTWHGTAPEAPEAHAVQLGQLRGSCQYGFQISRFQSFPVEMLEDLTILLVWGGSF